jgi:hypothetical protein
LWKPHCIDEFKGDFKFQGTWKKTYSWKKFSHSLCDSVPPINARGLFSDRLYQAWYCAQIDPWIWCKKDNVERRNNLSIEEFKNLYETPNKPVVITDIVTNWKSYSWTREKLIDKYGQIQFRTDFEFTDMKLVDYLLYCEKVIEERPVYLFDNSFAERAPEMLTEFEVPKYFKEDFFDLLNDHPKDRPSFRWLLVGPTRAGATFHKDPNFTSAWHGLILGKKKWILYPPDFTPLGVFPSEDGQQVTTPDTMVQWFMDFYPLKTPVTPIECVLNAGELMFIPSGWWHSVVNLEESVAITQNFVSRSNLKNVYDFLKTKKNKSLHTLFASKLEENFPDLHAELSQKSNTPLPNPWDTLIGDDTTDSTWQLCL